MTNAIRHRGPDDAGVWADARAETNVVLGHRRLSIIDLSLAGHQPMISANGRFAISYNGEIYNFPEMREELCGRGVQFEGRSDTEVLLEACALWGVEAALERSVGMFAFALWSLEEQTLTLVRDRIGEKPLYWYQRGARVCFASELTALLEDESCPRSLNRDAIFDYLDKGYVQAPLSIVEDVHKLEPGTMLVFKGGASPKRHKYWDLAKCAEFGAMNPVDSDGREISLELESLLRNSVRQKLIADVPVGVFLSGGIDSSLITALAVGESNETVRTYSISFDVAAYDEGPFARAVAKSLGTIHQDFLFSTEQCLSEVTMLSDWLDEPLADSSLLPTALISKYTKDHLTVALSGDGSDELFVGYSRYPWTIEFWNKLNYLPGALRKSMAALIDCCPAAIHTGLGAMLNVEQFGARVHHYSNLMKAYDLDDLYRRVVCMSPDPRSMMLQAPNHSQSAVSEEVNALDSLTRLQYKDACGFLPDDILMKTDRASMAYSLELRSPILDHRIIEYAFKLPRAALLANGVGKIPLRSILSKYLPEKLFDRQKMGFSAPIGVWLRGPLREWGESFINPRSLEHSGVFDPETIIRLWREHLSGARNHQNSLWAVLAFESWKQKQGLSW